MIDCLVWFGLVWFCNQRDKALDVCKGWPHPLEDLIKSTDPSNVSGHPVYDRDLVANYDNKPISREKEEEETQLPPLNNHYHQSSSSPPSYSRVIYIGDAAHPMSPFKGQGANQALLDALSLAKHVYSSDFVRPNGVPIDQALISFETEMIERANAKVIKSRLAATYLHNSDALISANITRASAAQKLF